MNVEGILDEQEQHNNESVANIKEAMPPLKQTKECVRTLLEAEKNRKEIQKKFNLYWKTNI